MNKLKFSKMKVDDPIITPHGEIIYELIGRDQDHGSADGHSLAHIVILPGKASLAHYHKVSQESYYILSGQAEMVINGETMDLGPGDACRLPAQR